MIVINRRRLVSGAGIGLISGMFASRRMVAQSTQETSPGTRAYKGPNLSNWITEVGDAKSNCQPNVTLADIGTQHFETHSELGANILSKPDMMAHNNSYMKFTDDSALRHVHVCEYKFRLPFLPSVGNTDFNGQTVEGLLAVWDGKATKLRCSVAFQWIVNPDPNLKEILQCWTPSGWQAIGKIAFDTQEHTVRMVLDVQRGTTSLQIDNIYFPSCFVKQSVLIGEDISATLSAEAISKDPGEQCNGGMHHRVEIKDWSWLWEPVKTCTVFLPLIAKS